jgi:hypothetical protein
LVSQAELSTTSVLGRSVLAQRWVRAIQARCSASARSTPQDSLTTDQATIDGWCPSRVIISSSSASAAAAERLVKRCQEGSSAQTIRPTRFAMSK